MSTQPLPLDPTAGAAPAPDPAAPNVTGAPAGAPTSPTAPQVGAGPTAPQPAAPPKESMVQGLTRGMGGKKYVVDGQGNVVEARTTADSGSGTFGSILGGIVMGALAGASKSRPGRIPSQEIGGGAGAGVGAAIDQSQQQDARNRGKAEQNFANNQAVQKMSREQAESAATINHLAADTARIAQESKFANDEHPLNIALKQAGLTEAAQNIQRNSQDILTNSFNIAKTLGEVLPPEAVSAFVTNWNDGQKHIPDIVQGRTAPLHNGETGADSAVGMHDVQTLKATTLPNSSKYKTYTSDKDGNPVAQERTMHAGASAYEYAVAALAGNSQLQKINEQQRIKGAAELQKAEIKEKNAAAYKDNSEGWAATHPGMVQGGGGTAVMSDDMKSKISALPPDKQAIISKYDANTQAALMSIVDSPGDIAFEKLFPASPRAKSGLLSGQQAEGILSQLIPGWSMQEYKVKQTAYKDAFNGPDGKAVQNYGNVLQHMAAAQDVVEKYRSGRDAAKFLNTATNKLQKEGFGTEASEISASLIPIQNEFSLLMSGGYSPKGDEQKAIATVLDPAATPSQLESAFKVFGNTGTIRLDNVNEGYKRASRGQNLPGIVSQSTVDAARHLNLEPDAQARLNKFNVGGSFFGDKGAAAGASAPNAAPNVAAPAATPGVQYATAPGKPRLMSKDGGKTWQPAQ